jgi:phospholipid transport system substrate-binding protein
LRLLRTALFSLVFGFFSWLPGAQADQAAQTGQAAPVSQAGKTPQVAQAAQAAPTAPASQAAPVSQAGKTTQVAQAGQAGKAAQDASGPADVVNAFHNALLNNMKHGKEYGCEGRIKHLEPVVDSSFDVGLIAQTVMRKHWPELSDAQHKQLIAAFREMTIVTYADQFASFGGEVFSVQNTQTLPNGDQLVHARLQPGSGDLVAFDYILHGQNGNWRIINIIADGVSDLALRTIQYNKLYEQKDKGFDGLLAWLQEQIKKTRAECK